jgi:valyl-tRNA synthetase
MRTDGPSYAESSERAKAIAHGEPATAEEVDALNLVPEAYRGLDRYAARKAVVADIDADGLMIQVEDKPIMQPFGDRSNVVIEPMLTDQWYVDAATLVKPVLEATRNGAIRIVPETWKKTWFNWLENIQPWTVSRQLWWGHRIPAWFDGDGNIFVAETEEAARAQAGGRPLRQDEDVLDTWFSSGLWPFATLGWPEETGDLKRHYPNDVLISGSDILFFWDARMAMLGLELTGQAPWQTLYLHGLVRDAHGQKMSKSKGNTVDPLGLVDQYGADALRFTLAAMESQGRDIKLDEKRVEGYRNFATKLWNAARFLQMNGVGASGSIAAPDATLPVNRWIIGEVVETLAKLNRAYDDLRYDDMADAIYHFVWGTFCDWYVELIKGAFDAETKAVASWAFDQILVMLHPLMPFITEELWNANERPYDLIVATWPEPEAQVDVYSKNEIEWLIAFVSEARAMRTELNIPWSATLEPIAIAAPVDQLNAQAATLARMAKLGPARSADSPPPGSAQIVVRGETYAFSLAEHVDLEAEKARLSKGVEAAEKERDSLAQRLANPNFTERAKPEAVEKARSDHDVKSAEAERLRAALERLG